MSGNGVKRIFISDLHMNTDESLKPATGNRYGWIGPGRIQALANFLLQIPQMGGVEDVVILGDLYDNWVCPATKDPAHFSKKIIKAKHNKPVFDALYKLSNELNVYYVHGNHDMLMKGSDLKEDFNINVVGSGEKPGRFTDHRFVAEHGHRYCLFNSPEPVKPDISILPSGFPVTRFYADSVYRTGHDPGYWKIIIDVLKDVIGDIHPTLVKDFLHGMANACGLHNKSDIWCGGLQYFPERVTVGQFEERFKDNYDNWDERTQTRVSKFEALLNDGSEWGLNLYIGANVEYFKPGEADIVIFGHTHYKMLYAEVADEITPGASVQSAKWIYANTGSWIDRVSPATFVETEKDPGNGLHWVRLWAVDEQGRPLAHPLAEACAKL